MTYTLWHCGSLIGETDFEGSDGAPFDPDRLHMAGVFRPTEYGRSLLPRLCGMLTACSELKKEMVLRGVADGDDLSPDEIEHLFMTTRSGAHIIDIGRVLSDVELHSPDGARITVASMGFMELAELARLSRKVGNEDGPSLAGVAADAPEFLVSVTLKDLTGQLQ